MEILVRNEQILFSLITFDVFKTIRTNTTRKTNVHDYTRHTGIFHSGYTTYLCNVLCCTIQMI